MYKVIQKCILISIFLASTLLISFLTFTLYSPSFFLISIVKFPFNLQNIDLSFALGHLTYYFPVSNMLGNWHPLCPHRLRVCQQSLLIESDSRLATKTEQGLPECTRANFARFLANLTSNIVMLADTVRFLSLICQILSKLCSIFDQFVDLIDNNNFCTKCTFFADNS